ncbi:MAG: hypothetical protein F6J93_08160 [Oscillatoria sp. SIO1A7]|nr:hypothetical protein [Oscillatoria sp. SIO1A7]
MPIDDGDDGKVALGVQYPIAFLSRERLNVGYLVKYQSVWREKWHEFENLLKHKIIDLKDNFEVIDNLDNFNSGKLSNKIGEK